jgi:sulfur-oxidizing protein SoxA
MIIMVKNRFIFAAAMGLALLLPLLPMLAEAGPQEDASRMQQYFFKLFPNVPKSEFVNGAYAFNKAGRENWEAIEEFPPYEPLVDNGKEMWDTPFANGKTYASCFPDGPAQRKNYPHWDAKREMVITMELAINECRKANGEEPLPYGKGPLAELSSYMSFASRGQAINVQVPNSPKALAAYESGKQFWLQRRGQLNFSCATCHAQNVGKHLRSNVLSPAIGHATSFPVYRSKWGNLGTLHRRFDGCNEQVRAKPFKLQGAEYRNLEYFLTIMGNGLTFNGPSARE